jgi:hypothetical protein
MGCPSVTKNTPILMTLIGLRRQTDGSCWAHSDAAILSPSTRARRSDSEIRFIRVRHRRCRSGDGQFTRVLRTNTFPPRTARMRIASSVA